MIFLDSRYVDGTLFTAFHAHKQEFHVTVFREWPEDVSSFFYYEWVDGDRIELISLRFLGDANQWWRVMDFNPEVIDPFGITPGSTIRIPSV